MSDDDNHMSEKDIGMSEKKNNINDKNDATFDGTWQEWRGQRQG